MKTILPPLAPPPRVARAAAVALLAMSLGASACARTAEERQLDAMRADIDRIRDDRDRADEPALPSEERGSPSAASAAPLASSPPPPPADPTVRVGAGGDDPASSDDYADPDDTTPRPRIRVLGSSRARGSDVENVDDGTSSPAGTSALDPEAKRAYDAAMSMVSAKQYDRALDAFAAFLVKWPDHPYSDHAMYWRGECYFARADYSHAAEQFEGVVARFPAGAKAPDALLKLGITRQRAGDTAGAKDAFARLAREYPQADAARRIPGESHP
jgi:tol-pal system protein YbgF